MCFFTNFILSVKIKFLSIKFNCFFQWKLRCCSFTFQNPEVNRANTLARLKPQKLLKKGKIPFFHQNQKLARLSSVCIRCQNGPRNRRERPIFDLGLSWFALITLKTASGDSFTKKTPRALECGNEIMLSKVTILFLEEVYDDTFWRKHLEPTNEKSSKLIWSNCQNPEIKNRKSRKLTIF